MYSTAIGQTGTIPGGGNNATTNKAGWTLAQNYYPLDDDGSGTWSGALLGWSFSVFNGTGDLGGACAIAPVQYQTNAWYHLVGVFDGTNCHLYVDGVLASPADLDTAMPAGTAYVPDTWDPIEVAGGRGIAGGINESFSEIAIYTNALSALAVSNHYYQGTISGSYSTYEATVIGDNAFMYWHMNAAVYITPNLNSLPTAANYGSAAATTTNLNLLAIGTVSPNALYQPGTMPGVAGPPFAGFGSPSYACAFNALGGAVDCGYSPAMDPTGNATPETVVGWFKDNPCDNNGRWNAVVSHSDSSWRFKIHNGQNVWDAGGGQDITGPAVNVNDGNWHMFAGVYNPAPGVSNNTIYIDGAVAVNVVTNRSIAGKTNLDVFIGGGPDYLPTAGGAQQYFAGRIAHIAYFNTALTAAQIQSLYSAAQPPPNILFQPANIATPQNGGGTALFTVTASGAATLNYQWWFTNNGTATQLSDGPNISGSLTSNLNLTTLSDSESGSYYVVIGNSYGSVTSIVATLSVSTEPRILSQTGGGTLQMYVGQNYALSVTAVGSNLTYQWYTNGVADTTAGTGSSYALNNVLLIQSGTIFQCAVSNALSDISSVLTTLTVVNLPASLTAGGTYSSNILALSPTAYWPMHEVAPAVQGDVETNLGTLGVLGTAYYADWDPLNVSNWVEFVRQVPGALPNDPDPALSLKRAPCSFLTVPHSSPQATIKPPFSVEVWVNPTAEIAFDNIIGQGGGTGLSGGATFGGFDLEYGNSGSGIKSNSFSFVLWSGTNGNNNELTSQSLFPEGQWYHVVATYDGTNIAMYVNGAAISSFQNGATTYSMNPDYWSPLLIGAGRWAGGGSVNPYQGVMDEVAIYTNVLTPSQVSQHYTDSVGASGVYKNDVLAQHPLLYYRMDAPPYTQPTRSTWPVLNSYGTTVLQNGVYTPGAVPGGQANVPIADLPSSVSPLFNGNGGYADVGIDPTLLPLGYQSFSYTAFFRGSPADDRSYSSIMSANDSTWRSEINAAGKVQAHGTADVTSTNVYNDGNWHQMVMTYQGNPTNGSGTNVLYVDGVLAGTNNTTGTNNYTGSPGPEVLIGNEYGFAVLMTGQTTYIGTERCFPGSICEAAFLNGTVLSAPQIQNLYDAAGVAPFFVKQPISTNVNANSAFVNTVIGNGSLSNSITYHWYDNGVALSDTGGYSGSATPSLTMNPVSPSMASLDYYVVATSTFGSVTSAVASLIVATNPVIVSENPSVQNVTLLGSSTIAFSVVASGATPLTYYWTSNSVVVQSGTSNTYTIKNLGNSAAGTYSVLVSNFLGTATTNWSLNIVPVVGNFVPAVVALKPTGFWLMNEPGDGTDLYNSVACHDYIGGNDGVYENTVLGVPGYDWDDILVGNYDTNTAAGFGQQGQTQNSCAYNIPNIVVSSQTSAEFTVQAWVQGTAIMPTSLNTPSICAKGLYSHEEFALDCGTHVTAPVAGDAYRFSIRNSAETQIDAGSTVVAGSDTNWHFIVGVCDQVNGQSHLYIDGTNAANNTIAAGAGEDNADDSVPVMIGARTSGVYDPNGMNEQFTGNIADVAIFNVALTSNQILTEFYAAGIAPLFVSQPVATNVISQGATESISATVEGTPSLSYQWLDTNGSPVMGATNLALVITNLTTNNSFTLQVSNLYGVTLSSTSIVTVITGPPVVEQDVTPLSAAAVAGSVVTLSAGVAGSQPITYGWHVNGAPVVNSGRISGANASTLVINDVQTGDAGTYQLFMTNSFGTNLTSAATLDIIPVLNFNNGGIGWHTQATISGSQVWLSSNQLQLTADLGNEEGSAFFDAPVYVGAFEASFTYQVTTGPSSSADGATFCIQNDPRGAAALGSGGGGLGVTTAITPSFELELNIYAGNGLGGVGVSWDSNGVIGPVLPAAPVVINSGDPIQVDVTYAGGVATATFTDTNAGASFTFSTNVNIPSIVGASTAYVGLTGADGGSKSTQVITDFDFVSLLPLSAQPAAGNTLVFSWPASSGAYVLVSSPVLGPSADWQVVNQPQTYANGEIQVSVPRSGGSEFYKLVVQVPGQ
jgi:hypothetical protein